MSDSDLFEQLLEEQDVDLPSGSTPIESSGVSAVSMATGPWRRETQDDNMSDTNLSDRESDVEASDSSIQIPSDLSGLFSSDSEGDVYDEVFLPSGDPTGCSSPGEGSSSSYTSRSVDVSRSPDPLSTETLNSSFKDSVTSGTERDQSQESVKRVRRKRGGFKKGVLKVRKGRRKAGSTTEAESSEAYDNILTNIASSEVTDIDDSLSTEYNSTLPPSDVGEEEGEELKEEEEEDDTVQSGTSTSKSSRKRKSIGRKKKYRWKKETLPEVQDIYMESQPTKADVETLVDPDELGKNSLANLPLVQENLSLIRDYLRLMLPDPWAVSILKSAVIISEIVAPENPVIRRSISWSMGGVVRIFVCGFPLKQNHLLWQLTKPDAQNCGAVADYLTRVSNSFILLRVCSGVLTCEELWNTCDAGVVQRNYGTPCLRHLDCSLLVGGRDICASCVKLTKNLKQKAYRSSGASEGSTPAATTNIKYLDKEALTQRVGQLQKDRKYLKQKVRRLEERITKLIQEKSESIDCELSADFVQIMKKNVEKMTPFQKLFWQQQSLALSKHSSKGMRWHPAMIRLALHLRITSPAAYELYRGVISLPSQRRLFDYSQFTDVKEGVQQELLEDFSETIKKKCPEEHQQYFYLLLDEMNIRSDLVYSSRTGELIGFTNISDVESALKELEEEMKGQKTPGKKLAKKVLVLMLCGATTDIRFVPAIFSTDDLSAAQLYSRTWYVTYAVEETGAKVLAVICDGASVNRKFVAMNFNSGKTNFLHVTVNSAAGDSRQLFFVIDPPHLMKTYRNCLANSFSHRESRTLWKNRQQLSWKAIEALFEITKNDKFKATKLTKGHIKLSSFSCMNVRLAVEVLSKSVAEALVRNKDKSPLKEEFSQELVDFILIMNRTFDCFNGGDHSIKKTTNSDLQEYCSVDDERFTYLENTVLSYFADWANDVANRRGNFRKEERSRMMISHQSLEALKITIHSFISIIKFLLRNGAPSVSSRRMNQDPLEQYFSVLRRLRGSDENPTLKSVLHTRQALHVQGSTFLAGGSKGNTEVLKREFELDDTALPSRKKSKQ